MAEIKPLACADARAVEALLDAAFGTDRKSRTAYQLRAGGCPIEALSFAAFDGERLLGTLQSWPVLLAGDGDELEELVMVGPVAVLPQLQGSGVGTLMMRALCDAAADGECAMMMIGDPSYYGRFGFTASATAGWRVPGPVERQRLLARSPRALPIKGELRRAR